jgi:hypothetical protein
LLLLLLLLLLQLLLLLGLSHRLLVHHLVLTSSLFMGLAVVSVC